MKRSIQLQQLSREHHQGLILARLCRNDAPVYKGLPSDPEGKRYFALAEFNGVLTKHFAEEEQVLIPLINSKNKTLKTICEKIIAEHKEIISKIETLKSATNEITSALDDFGRTLETHIRNEERIYFPKIEEHLSEEELGRIETALKEFSLRK